MDFNKKHADKELPPGQFYLMTLSCYSTDRLLDYPNQALLEKSLDFVFDSAERQRYIEKMHFVSRTQGIDATLAKYDIDVIIGPAESGLTELVAAAGWCMLIDQKDVSNIVIQDIL